MVNPTGGDLGGPGHSDFDAAGIAEVDDVRLVVVGLFPCGVAQGDAFVDPAWLVAIGYQQEKYE